MESRLPLRCQVSRRALRRQAWLITLARSLDDLIGWIFQSEIPASPDCGFYLALWKKGKLSLLVPDGTCLGLNEVNPDGLHVCLDRPRGLKFEKDTWRGTPHNALLICLPLSERAADKLRWNSLSVSLSLLGTL